MGRFRFRELQHRFENRRRGVSRLLLGGQIEDPLEVLGPSSYGSLEGLPVVPLSTMSKDIEAVEGTAFDSIVVEASDGTLHHAGDGSDDSWFFTVAFEKWNSLRLGESNEGNPKEDNPNNGGNGVDGGNDGNNHDDDDAPTSTTLVMKLQRPDGIGEAWFHVHEAEEIGDIQKKDEDSKPQFQEQLRPLLKEGANPVIFCCLRRGEEAPNQVLQFARASICLWKNTDKVLISDIDGTLTKSNARGVLGTILSKKYDMVSHSGICRLLSKLVVRPHATKASDECQQASPTTRMVYLTSRPIHLANKTREFLSGLIQQDEDGSETFGLPQGALLGFGGNLANVLSMEVLSKTSQAFKANELEIRITGPFQRAFDNSKRSIIHNNESSSSIFVAAFGNNLNDVQAYHKIGMDLDRIFVVDKNSIIKTFDQLKESPPTEDAGFPPHSWYNNRILTVFEKGYSDEKLHSFLGVGDDEDQLS